MGWFWPSWLRRRRAALADLVILLYARPACHLCDEAKKLLDSRRKRWGFRLRVIDVDADAALLHQFGDCVPVVVVNGKVRFRGRVSPMLLDRLLLGEQAK